MCQSIGYSSAVVEKQVSAASLQTHQILAYVKIRVGLDALWLLASIYF